MASLDSLFDLKRWRADAAVAVGFLSRLPVRTPDAGEPGRLARASRAFPLAGALVGAIGAAVLVLADSLSLPWLASALLAIGAMALVTGALHEDGLADCADGLAGGGDRAARLAIMRDSRLGTFGAVALVLILGLRAAALAALLGVGMGGAALIAAASLSRAALPPLMRALPPARSDGLGHQAGRPAQDQVMVATILGALFAVLFLPAAAALAGIAAAAASVTWLAWQARAKLGGQTGDVLGAAALVAETAFLLASAAVLA